MIGWRQWVARGRVNGGLGPSMGGRYGNMEDVIGSTTRCNWWENISSTPYKLSHTYSYY